MKHQLKATAFSLFFFLITWVGLPITGLAQEPPSASSKPADAEECPHRRKMFRELVSGYDNLQKIQTSISNLLSGKEVIQGGGGALFLVDLNDENAVAKRIEELKKSTSGEHTVITIVPDLILDCALKNDSTRAFVDTLTELQREVDLLSLQFFELPKDKRASLLQLHAQATEQAASIEHIKEEQTHAENKRKEAEKALKEAASTALTPETIESGELASARAVLEKVKMDLANLEIQFNNNKKEKAFYYQNKFKTLAEIEARLKQDNNIEKIKMDYQDVVKMWRNIVNMTVINKNHVIDVSMIPPLPEYPEELLVKVKSAQEGRQYAKSYNEAKDYHDSLESAIKAASKEEIDRRNKMLLQVGSIRAMLLNRLINSGNKWPLEFSKDYFEDLKREFRIFPHRWLVLFYLQRQAINEILSAGFTSGVKMLQDILIHLGLIVLPIILWVRINKLADMLHELRFYLLSKRRASFFAASLAIWLNRLIPYISWLILLAVLEIVQIVMLRSIFNLVIPLLLVPYAQIYCIYRITLLLIEGFLTEVLIEAKIV